tara:strand:- start:947 stop:1504 length:558 start_codon:yes stop_codon:yes gene_type:complete
MVFIFLSFGIFITENYMNLLLLGIIIFVIVYLFLNWFARTSSKKIATTIKKIAVYLSLILATLLAIGGKYIFSLPFLFVILSGLKIKGFTALQMWQLWRLIQFVKNSGKFSHGKSGQTQGSSSVTTDEAYKLLGLKKGVSKEEVLKAANQLQKKIHPDMNREVKTERLSQLVNEAKEKIIKSDFS